MLRRANDKWSTCAGADDSMSPPEFFRPLTDKCVPDGESFEISCSVKGDPEPHVTWTKNGKVKNRTLPGDARYNSLLLVNN